MPPFTHFRYAGFGFDAREGAAVQDPLAGRRPGFLSAAFSQPESDATVFALTTPSAIFF
jgi:hypothetical protein